MLQHASWLEDIVFHEILIFVDVAADHRGIGQRPFITVGTYHGSHTTAMEFLMRKDTIYVNGPMKR